MCAQVVGIVVLQSEHGHGQHLLSDLPTDNIVVSQVLIDKLHKSFTTNLFEHVQSVAGNEVVGELHIEAGSCAYLINSGIQLTVSNLSVILVQCLGIRDEDLGITDNHLIHRLLIGGVPLAEHEALLQSVAIATLVAEGGVAGLVCLLVFLVEGHGHTWIPVQEHVIMCGLLHLHTGFLSWKTIRIQYLVDRLTGYRHGILHAT